TIANAELGANATAAAIDHRIRQLASANADLDPRRLQIGYALSVPAMDAPVSSAGNAIINESDARYQAYRDAGLWANAAPLPSYLMRTSADARLTGFGTTGIGFVNWVPSDELRPAPNPIVRIAREAPRSFVTGVVDLVYDDIVSPIEVAIHTP